MYKIIGADGKEYGPIPTEVLRDWIAQGRADAHTRILAEGSTEWKPLSAFPEFASPPSPPPGNPPTLPSSLPTSGRARELVNGPAIALMIISPLNALYMVGSSLMVFFSPNTMMMSQNGAAPPFSQPFAAWMTAVPMVILGSLSLLASALIFFGAFKLRKLESYGLAMTASILAMIPCFSGACCLFSLPFGIWALVVLCKPEVKSAFH